MDTPGPPLASGASHVHLEHAVMALAMPVLRVPGSHRIWSHLGTPLLVQNTVLAETGRKVSTLVMVGGLGHSAARRHNPTKASRPHRARRTQSTLLAWPHPGRRSR